MKSRAVLWDLSERNTEIKSHLPINKNIFPEVKPGLASCFIFILDSLKRLLESEVTRNYYDTYMHETIDGESVFDTKHYAFSEAVRFCKFIYNNLCINIPLIIQKPKILLPIMVNVTYTMLHIFALERDNGLSGFLHKEVCKFIREIYVVIRPDLLDQIDWMFKSQSPVDEKYNFDSMSDDASTVSDHVDTEIIDSELLCSKYRHPETGALLYDISIDNKSIATDSLDLRSLFYLENENLELGPKQHYSIDEPNLGASKIFGVLEKLGESIRLIEADKNNESGDAFFSAQVTLFKHRNIPRFHSESESRQRAVIHPLNKA